MESINVNKVTTYRVLNSTSWEIWVAITFVIISSIGEWNTIQSDNNWLFLSSLTLELLIIIILVTIKNLSKEIREISKKVEEFYAYYRQVNEIVSYLKELSDKNELLLDLTTIIKNLVKLKQKPQPLMLEVMIKRLQREAKIFRLIGGQHTFIQELQNVKSSIQMIFENFIGELEEGDRYLTVTNLDFWSYKTLSHKMQFVDCNVAAVKKGVKIKRVFILDGKLDLLTHEEIVFLKKYHEATLNSPNIETKVCLLQGWEKFKDYRALDKIGTFAICQKKIDAEQYENILIQVDFAKSLEANTSERVFDKIKVIVDLQNVKSEMTRFNRWFEKEESVMFLGQFLNHLANKFQIQDPLRLSEGEG